MASCHPGVVIARSVATKQSLLKRCARLIEKASGEIFFWRFSLFFILQQLFEQCVIPGDIFQLHDGRDFVARVLT